MKAVVCSLVLVCATVAYAAGAHFEKISSRSTWFEPLRENKTLETIKECNYEVQKPYGILEQTFPKKMKKDAGVCLWKLSAPENHIIHVISITIDFEDETPSIRNDEKLTTVYLWDGMIPEKNRLFRYSPQYDERYNPFVQSLSSGRDMIIEIEYHLHPEFSTQKVAIKYEFIDLDKMRELLT